MPQFDGRSRPPKARRRRAVLLDVAVTAAVLFLVPYTLLDPPAPADPDPVWVA